MFPLSKTFSHVFVSVIVASAFGRVHGLRWRFRGGIAFPGLSTPSASLEVVGRPYTVYLEGKVLVKRDLATDLRSESLDCSRSQQCFPINNLLGTG